MTKSEEQVEIFLAKLKEYGWTLGRVGGSIVTIQKEIGRDNREEFVKADMEYYSILAYAPGKGGSIWGTDGGGIGALSAMKSGRFTMNKSGVGARFINALRKKI